MGRDRTKKHGVAVQGSWLPMPLAFLRSRACASLSPHGIKLLIDVLALLGPNATRNGDLSLSPRSMRARGWTSRATLQKAVAELVEHGLLAMTRQGSRLDCSLYACGLFPIQCDAGKLDHGAVGSYSVQDWRAHGEAAPSEEQPASWRRVRKTVSLSPPRNSKPAIRSATEQTHANQPRKKAGLFRHGTKTPVLSVPAVPPRVTSIDKPSAEAEPEPAIDCLKVLWERVGCRVTWRDPSLPTASKRPSKRRTARKTEGLSAAV